MNPVLVVIFGVLFGGGIVWWRQAVVGTLVLAVFEGALRKWVFPSEQQWVYLFKDVLLLGAYAGFAARRPARKQGPVPTHPAAGALALLGLLTGVQLANPALPNLWVGLFGVKAYLLYAPLLYLVPRVFRDAESLRKFWGAYLALGLGPLILGLVQFATPPDHVLNRYAWGDELAPGVATLPSGLRPRVTGTFPYISGYTAYLTLVVLMGLALLLFGKRSPGRRLLWLVLVLALANLLMTGSRGPFITLGPAMVAMLALAVTGPGSRRARAVLLSCVGLPLLALLVGGAFPEAYREFVERAQGSADLPERLVGVVTTPLWALGEAGLLGYGVGSTHQALAFLAPGENPAPPAEGELERIVLELGPLGLGLVLLIRVLVTARLWRALRAGRGGDLKPYLVTAFLYTLISLPGNLVFNHIAHLFYWFLAGFASIPSTPVTPRARPETGIREGWKPALAR